ncbi:hypothetical protein BX600DRAFT_430243 [Xylariales sp. PMI_506]|nr:hypothetical protein BX600DRAFT_430243 [Xylariales sp. PMI_506]
MIDLRRLGTHYIPEFTSHGGRWDGMGWQRQAQTNFWASGSTTRQESRTTPIAYGPLPWFPVQYFVPAATHTRTLSTYWIKRVVAGSSLSGHVSIVACAAVHLGTWSQDEPGSSPPHTSDCHLVLHPVCLLPSSHAAQHLAQQLLMPPSARPPHTPWQADCHSVAMSISVLPCTCQACPPQMGPWHSANASGPARLPTTDQSAVSQPIQLILLSTFGMYPEVPRAPLGMSLVPSPSQVLGIEAAQPSGLLS